MYNISLHITADVAQATAQVKAFSKELAQAVRAGMGGGSSSSPMNMAALSTASTTKMIAGMTQASQAAKVLAAEHVKVVAAMKVTARTKDSLSANFRDHGRVVRDTAKNYVSFRQISFGLFEPIKYAIWGLSTAWKFSLLTSGYMITRFVKHATTEFLDFEKLIAKIQLRGAPGRGPFGTFAGPAMDISRTFGVSATDVAGALETATSAGFKRVGDAALVASAAVRLAIGTISDVKPAAEAITNVLESFAMGADKATHVADLLTIGMRESTLSMQDFAHGTERLAPLFHQIGGSIEDLVATTSLLSHSAHGDVAIFQELAQSMQRLVAPSGKSAHMMQAFGIGLKKSKDGGVDVLSTLDAIGKRMREFSRDPAIQQRWLAQIIPGGQGGRAQRALLRLFAESPEDIQRIRNAALNSVGAVDKAMREQNATMYRQWQVLGASVGRITLMLGQSFAKLWDPAVKGIDEFLKRFEKSDAVDDLRDHIISFGAQVGVTIINLIKAVRELASTLDTLVKPFKLLGWIGSGAKEIGSATAEITKNVWGDLKSTTGHWHLGEMGHTGASGKWEPGFQRGGIVPGSGHGDVFPAMLEPGELVVPKSVVRRIGSGLGMAQGGQFGGTGPYPGPGMDKNRSADPLDKMEAMFLRMAAAAASRMAERAAHPNAGPGQPGVTSGAPFIGPSVPRRMMIPEDLNVIRMQEQRERIEKRVADQNARISAKAALDQGGRRESRLDALRSLQHRRGMGGGGAGFGGRLHQEAIGFMPADPFGGGGDGGGAGSRIKLAPWEGGAVVPDIIQAPRSGGPMRMTPHGMRNIPGGGGESRGGARPMPAGQPGISQGAQPMSGEQLAAMSSAVRGQVDGLPMTGWMSQVAANLSDMQQKLAGLQQDMIVVKNAA